MYSDCLWQVEGVVEGNFELEYLLLEGSFHVLCVALFKKYIYIISVFYVYTVFQKSSPFWFWQ